MELKPCPLCGGKAHIEKGLLGTYGVICKCSSHLFYDHEYDKYGAARLWNTRAERTCRIKEDADTGCFLVCSECGAIQPEEWTVYYCWCCGAKVVR